MMLWPSPKLKNQPTQPPPPSIFPDVKSDVSVSDLVNVLPLESETSLELLSIRSANLTHVLLLGQATVQEAVLK